MTNPKTRPLRSPRVMDNATANVVREQDLAWESDLTQLLARLEPLQRRLIELRERGEPAALIVETVTTLLLQLVEFAERSPMAQSGGEQFSQLRVQADEVFSDAGDLLRRLPRTRGFSFAWLFRLTQGNERRDRSSQGAERRRLFGKVIRGLFNVVEAYFTCFTSGFGTASQAFAWTSAAEVFVAQLRSFRFVD